MCFPSLTGGRCKSCRVPAEQANLLILFKFAQAGEYMGKLTTHVLDTSSGRPGRRIGVKLYALDDERRLVATAVTNDDGRTNAPLMDGETWRAGTYELEFAVGPYFRDSGGNESDAPFLDDVVIRVNLVEDDHYHVPLLVSPWSYSTYRGS